MSDETSETTPIEESKYPEIEYVVQPQPKRPRLVRRVGCGIFLVLWFGFLLLPLALFILAINGQITINHPDNIPDRHEHPRFQIYLQMEPGTRGLQITRSSIKQDRDTNLCLEVNVSYLLWEGQGDSAQYCDCYKRDIESEDWSFVTTATGGC